MFKFTICELLLLTLVVALAVGWWLDRSRLAKNAQAWKEETSVLVKGVQQHWHDEWMKGNRWELPDDLARAVRTANGE
ncbi:MAG TPA: hypothetical protein VMP01_00590 [Pirellulaceae bacterium]|nr:hypothetical protein [Pirellulaceae bacterium]